MLMELFGYIGIALTVIGQITIAGNYFIGQGCWLVANAFYLIKAIKQKAGRAEIVRNVIMSAITTGCIIVNAILL